MRVDNDAALSNRSSLYAHNCYNHNPYDFSRRRQPMTSLQDFKRNILGPLLRGEQPTADAPITLFAADIEHPLDYIFESERWDEISGASRRLARAGDRLHSILANDGYAADE